MRKKLRDLRLMFVVVLCLGVTPQLMAQDVYIVAVGVADYPGTDMDLTLCADDATDFASFFKSKADAMTVLIKNSNATRENVLSAIRQQFAKASKNDRVVLFYSGHGYEGGFMVYDDYLSYEDIKSAIAQSKCSSKMIFADACYSGTIRGESSGRASSSGNTMADTRVMLFLSSRDGEVSYESPDMDNGYYTMALLEALKGKADRDNNDTITALELFLYVSRRVKELTFDEQHPVMWGKFSNNMPVMVL